MASCLGSRRRPRFDGSRRIRIGELSPELCGPLSVRSARPTRPAFCVSAASRPATAMASGQTGQPPRQYTTLQRSVCAILKQPGRHPRPCRPRFLTESAPFSSNPLSLAMVLTAIPTAMRGRLRVFVGVRCRTDSLQIRISGQRPTAADASPVTYKQVLPTAGTDGIRPTEGSTSPRFASRSVDRLGG